MIKALSGRLQQSDGLDKIIFLIAILINGIVFANSILHHPISGYDSDENMRYIAVLYDHLPDQKDSNEYFSPPLPYFLPSIGYWICTRTQEESCIIFGGRVTQAINVILSLAITILFLKISDLLQPGNKYYKIGVLSFLALPTVYYKTFSQVRAEPYVAFFTVVLLYLLLKILKEPMTDVIKRGLILGIVIGLLILSRQWGFLLLPALLVFVIPLYIWNKGLAYYYSKVISIAFVTGFLVGGWFYIHLHNAYGSVMTFNRKTQAFSFSNQPVSFYRNTGLGDMLLFKAPTRRTFDNQFIPVFYSEIWGDYWGYFVFIREKTLFGANTNKLEITPYLGRVNFASIAPSLMMVGGILLGGTRAIFSLQRRRTNPEYITSALFALMIVSSFAGYTWFLISHPLDSKGVTIKATYMIQIFMLLPFITASFLEKLRGIQPRLYFAVMVILALVFIHNLPAMITRHWIWLL